MKNRYSFLIRPLSLIIDLIIINGVIFYIADQEYLQILFLGFINIFWIISSFYTGFYRIYRQTVFLRLLSLISLQFGLFFLCFFTYFGVFREGQVVNNQFLIFTSILVGVSLVKFISYYALKYYRAHGKNYRNVIIIGLDVNSKKFVDLFQRKTGLGYRYYGFFSSKKSNNDKYLGPYKDCYDYMLDQKIDEVYCSAAQLTKEQIKSLTKFTNQHVIVLKIIPITTELYSKKMDLEYFDNNLVLKVKKLPFDHVENIFIKRSFDLFFSSFIMIFILSWLVPLFWILIKIESKGPVLFKQTREGLNGEKFICYKFRSMKLNHESDRVHVTKNDERVTRMGAFLRKTSLDELPQFFNVFLGDMSTVGPRPHMSSLSLEYQKDIDNYVKRHEVKPGITGLAQISGYRGEVKTKADIKNRIRMDIFYIENWSFLLDIKIILQTILNVLKGEEKAY